MRPFHQSHEYCIMLSTNEGAKAHSRVSHSVAGLKHKTKHFSKFNRTTLGFSEMSKSNLFDVIIKQRFAERPQICDFAVALIKVRIF